MNAGHLRLVKTVPMTPCRLTEVEDIAIAAVRCCAFGDHEFAAEARRTMAKELHLPISRLHEFVFRTAESPALRPVLLAYASGWSGLHEGLQALGRVPAEVSSRGARAPGDLSVHASAKSAIASKTLLTAPPPLAATPARFDRESP